MAHPLKDLGKVFFLFSLNAFKDVSPSLFIMHLTF